MNDPLVQKASADLAEIRQEIARLQARERKLKQFIDAYAEDDVPTPEGATLFPVDFKTALARLPYRENKAPLTVKDRVAGAVLTILADGQPRHTRVLLDELNSQGVSLGGATDKVLALSRILSNDKRFVPSRTLGWSLKK